MTPAPFAIPDEEEPEPGRPSRIEHGCDYMKRPDGSLEYHYNFIDYVWVLGSEEIAARAYLDTVDEVIVHVAARQLLDDASLGPLVRFLQRRFLVIQSLSADNIGSQGPVPVYRNQAQSSGAGGSQKEE